MDRDEFNLGRFRFDLRQRELKRDGIPVQLGSRARDILWVLASANGEVVSKDELMMRVWHGLVVEENNIQVLCGHRTWPGLSARRREGRAFVLPPRCRNPARVSDS
jgi:DNA-binding response OmpR family regulator